MFEKVNPAHPSTKTQRETITCPVRPGLKVLTNKPP